MSVSMGSTLPRSLRTLIITNVEEPGYCEAPLPQLCVALWGRPALERFSLSGQDLQLHLAPLLTALQHSTRLTHLELRYCNLTGLPYG